MRESCTYGSVRGALSNGRPYRDRREFITLLGGAATWPFVARAQQPAMPVVGGSADASARLAAAFRKGLNETGYVEGQNVTVEYHWLEGQYDRLPALVAGLVRRQVAVIATPGGVPALAAKAATATIPIVFGVGDDPVRLGLVASLARPGGNATGINILTSEVVAKRLRLLHDLAPKAARVAVLVNPGNTSVAKSTVREVQKAAPTMGLQIQILNATTIGEIDAAFATLARERSDALFVAPDGLFVSRRVQLHTHHCVSAATNAHRPYHFRERFRSGRQRLCRELPAAGRQCHRFHHDGGDDGRQVVGAAERDCAARRPGCLLVQPGNNSDSCRILLEPLQSRRCVLGSRGDRRTSSRHV
jgi:putative ABC transport system substrate-binding protein